MPPALDQGRLLSRGRRVIAARCPYAQCSELVFSIVGSTSEVVHDLASMREVLSNVEDRFGAELVSACLALFVATVFAISPALVAIDSLSWHTCGPARAGVLFGTVFIVVPAFAAAIALVRAIIHLARDRAADRRAFVSGEAGGLRLVPEERAYR
jgi:hypothetical protein